jgi:hypothetical protein
MVLLVTDQSGIALLWLQAYDHVACNLLPLIFPKKLTFQNPELVFFSIAAVFFAIIC